MMSKGLDYSSPPFWAKQMNLTQKEMLEIREITKTMKDFSDPRDKTFFEYLKLFSQQHQIRFDMCCVYALDLYFEKRVDYGLVEKHLLKKLETFFKDSSDSVKAYKTIILVGKTGEGKKTVFNDLMGVPEFLEERSSQTGCSNLYVSDQRKLNIIDTEGFGTCQNRYDMKLMKKICLETRLWFVADPGIDAIILIWQPKMNQSSEFVEILLQLQQSFTDDVVRSCIVLIPGNSSDFAENSHLMKYIAEATEEINKKFQYVRIMNYDMQGNIEKQLLQLMEKIKKVQPYKEKVFDRYRMEQFLSIIQALKMKLGKIEKK